MKKILLTVFILAVALFVLGACGGNDAPDVPQDDAVDEQATPPGGVVLEPVVLRVSESHGGPGEFILEAGRRFTEQNPHITIEFINIAADAAAGAIAADGPLGIGPDVFAAPHSQMGTLYAGGHILEVPGNIADRLRGDLFTSGIIALTHDSTLLGYPIAMETYALFYNRALIASAHVPVYFEEVIEFSRLFAEDNPDRFGFVMSISAFYSTMFITADGNRLFGPYGTDPVNTNINSPVSVAGMEFFQSLREVLDMDAGDLSSSFTDAAFTAGNAAMHITESRNLSVFENLGVDFGVTAIPALPSQLTPPASFVEVRAMFVSAYTEHPAEAHAFAQFLVSSEMQHLRYEITGELPSTVVPTDNHRVAGFFRQLEYAFPLPSIPQMGLFWPAMGVAVANIWNGMDVQEQLDIAHYAIVD